MQLRNGNLESCTIRCLNCAEFDYFFEARGCVVDQEKLGYKVELKGPGALILGLRFWDYPCDGHTAMGTMERLFSIFFLVSPR